MELVFFFLVGLGFGLVMSEIYKDDYGDEEDKND